LPLSPARSEALGRDGDDLLWSGLNGAADPKVDRELVIGLTAAGVDAVLIATEPGADIVSGGVGVDTLSFGGEFGRFNANLATGIITSDRAGSGSFVLEDVIGQIVDGGAGGTIFTFNAATQAFTLIDPPGGPLGLTDIVSKSN
jgi:hypothetical protein